MIEVDELMRRSFTPNEPSFGAADEVEWLGVELIDEVELHPLIARSSWRSSELLQLQKNKSSSTIIADLDS